MPGLETHYSAADIERRLLAGIRAAGLNPGERLTPEALAALDHFHTGGLRASRELLEIVPVESSHRVLDIGAGLGGAARMLASETGCQVDCLEMSADYCAGGALLNRLTGLERQVTFYRGSALDLPFPDATFDVAWMQNVGMNIEDKSRLYREIARVLKPAGRFAFQEIAAGNAPCSAYPLPWASQPSGNFLVSADRLCALLRECGFTLAVFEDTSEEHLRQTTVNATPAAPGQLGLGVFVDDLREKASNAHRSLKAGQVRLVRGVFSRVAS